MRYLGGKFKTAKDIAKHINSHHDAYYYLEPFMGSCWVTSQITLPCRLAGDIHEEIVELYSSVQKGWVPPDTLSEEEYKDIRDNRASGKYPKQLVAFVGFGCAYAGSYWRKYAGPNYASVSKRSILKKAKKLTDVKYFCSDYKDINPQGCVIYCDPPYAKKFSYRITGIKGNGKFNNEEFWDIMNKWSEKNVVYVSEYTAPPNFELVMQKEISLGVHTHGVNEKRIEKLFYKNCNFPLFQEKLDIYSVLGVNTNWNGFK